jgi:cell filamentation protein
MGKKPHRTCSTKSKRSTSRYDADDVYCIPGTAVLKNKAGITNQGLLDEYEADFTAIRILELAHTPVEGSFDLEHLCKIHAYSNTVFKALAAENYLNGLEPTAFARRLAHYLSEINAIHPFGEGNGRVQRLFISQLAEQAGYTLDYSALGQEEIYPVMQASFLGNEQPLAELILKIVN